MEKLTTTHTVALHRSSWINRERWKILLTTVGIATLVSTATLLRSGPSLTELLRAAVTTFGWLFMVLFLFDRMFFWSLFHRQGGVVTVVITLEETGLSIDFKEAEVLLRLLRIRSGLGNSLMRNLGVENGVISRGWSEVEWVRLLRAEKLCLCRLQDGWILPLWYLEEEEEKFLRYFQEKGLLAS